VSFGESEEGSTREVGKFGNEGEEENKKFEEKSLGLDVWAHPTQDTVTAVAISDTFLAWSSQTQGGKEYAIFIKSFFDLKNDRFPITFTTDDIVQGLDFDDSKEPTHLVGADFQGHIYVIDIKNQNPEAMRKTKVKASEASCIPTSITISNKHAEFCLIGIGTMQGEIVIIRPESHKKPNDWVSKTLKEIHGSNIMGVHFLQCTRDCIRDKGEKKIAEDCVHIRVVVAYKDGLHGYLKVVRLELNDEEIVEKTEFKQLLNLNVEFGDVISSSDDGDRFSVVCGDQKARVFKKTSYFESRELLAPRTLTGELKRSLKSVYDFVRFLGTNKEYQSIGSAPNELGNFQSISTSNWIKICESWELYWVFDLNAVPLAVSMSGDGKRLAIGQENSETVVCAIDSGCKIHSFKNTGRVRSVSLNSNGKFLLTGGFDNTLRLRNIEAGFNKTKFLCFKGHPDEIIQSVSMDDAGRFIAVGTLNGRAMVFELKQTGETKSAFINRQTPKEVYVVQLSGDGKVFAYGGYNNQVMLVEITHELEDTPPEKDICCHNSNTEGLPFPRYIWGLDIKENKDSYLIVVGSWDHNAYLCSFQKNPLKKQRCLVFPQGDRVFDVAISRDSTLMLVGGRDMKTRLYDLQQIFERDMKTGMHDLQQSLNDTPDIIPMDKCHCSFEDPDIIYCVAISKNKKYIAYGGIHKQVTVYMLGQHKGTDSPKLVQRWQHQHTLHRIKFVDDNHLVAISEDGCCALYRIDESKLAVRLMLDGTGNSVACTANENNILAVAHGFSVTIYGEEFGYGVFDRPSFEVAKTLLKDPVALKIALDAHPTLTNCFESRSGVSLLSYAVQKQCSEAVSLLLDSELTSGLIIHSDGGNLKQSALTIALQTSNRNIVEKLLSAITTGKIANTDDLFETGFFSQFSEEPTVTTVFKAVAVKFPASFIAFLKCFCLENCTAELLESFESAELNQPVYVALPFRSPKDFWKHYYADSMANAYNFATTKPENILQAQRIPFPKICRENENEDSPLEVIINTSASLKDYSAFSEDTIVHALVMLEWGVTGPYFMVRTIMYLVFYGVSVLLSWNLALEHGKNPINPVYRKGWAIFFPIVLIPMCLYGLRREALQFESELELEKQKQIRKLEKQEQEKQKQIQLEEQKQSQQSNSEPEQEQEKDQFWVNFFETLKTWRNTAFFKTFETWLNAAWNHFDLWNILDFFAFSTQLVTAVMILAGSNCVLGPAAISMLLLTWKLYSYARALPTVGTLVRIVTRTMMDMGNFLCFLGCWLLGFAFAFFILLPNLPGFRTVHESMFTVTMMIYGDFDLLKEAEDDAGILAYIIFQLMMLSSVVTMLNLLIAILSDSYQNVKENAIQLSVFELATIIRELKKADKNRKGEKKSRNLSSICDGARKWVHILKPVKHQSSDNSRSMSYEIKEIKKIQREMQEAQKGTQETQKEMQETQKQILEKLRFLQHVIG